MLAPRPYWLRAARAAANVVRQRGYLGHSWQQESAMRADQVGCGLVPDIAALSSFPGKIPAPDRAVAYGAFRGLPGGHHVVTVGRHPGSTKGDDDSGRRRRNTWLPARRAVRGPRRVADRIG